jgi:hypothetical protein
MELNKKRAGNTLRALLDEWIIIFGMLALIWNLSEKSCPSVSNTCTSKMQHRYVVFYFFLPPYQESSKPIHPGVGSFNNPMSSSVSRYSFTVYSVFSSSAMNRITEVF